jgi:pimeloyl-ACP methyl ester carboxylesterase
VIPSLPGFGWSGKPAETGWGVERIADAWAVLMSRLGYERYGAQGGDWGAGVSMALAARHPDEFIGLHLNYAPVGPDEDTLGDLTDREQAALADAAGHLEWGMGYSLQQGTRPQTLGYALLDSPAGLCAWIAEKFWAWTDHDGDPLDAVGADAILDDVSVYWHTRSAASAARIYWEVGFARPSGRDLLGELPGVDAPVGISIFPREIMRPSRRWCERRFTDIRFFEEPEHGGHFAALEQPETLVDHVRSTFRAIRAG